MVRVERACRRMAQRGRLSPVRDVDALLELSSALASLERRMGRTGRFRLARRDERRFTGRQINRKVLEVRGVKGASNGHLVELTGEPIIYSSAYDVVDQQHGEFREVMRPGVAAHLLATSDTRLLVNHSSIPLARTQSGTLRLTDTPKALTFTGTVDRRLSAANDALVALERGDLTGMSIAFTVAPGGDEWKGKKRIVSKLESLDDISLVTFPCSPGTSARISGSE